MPFSEDDLLNRLRRDYAEQVRVVANLARRLGMAAKAFDPVGFAAAQSDLEAARKRAEAYRLSIEICLEMIEEARAASMNRPHLPLLLLVSRHSHEDGEPIRIVPAA